MSKRIQKSVHTDVKQTDGGISEPISKLEERLDDVIRTKQNRVTRGNPIHPRNIAILKPAGRYLVSAQGSGYAVSETGPAQIGEIKSRLAALEEAQGEIEQGVSEERIQDVLACVRENAQSVMLLKDQLRYVDELVASHLESVSGLKRRFEAAEHAAAEEHIVKWDDIEGKPDLEAMHDGCSRMLVLRLKRSRIDRPYAETFSVHRAGYARFVCPVDDCVVKLDGRKLHDGIGIVGEGSHTLVVESGVKDRSRDITVVIHM
jgi:hypothetical protein